MEDFIGKICPYCKTKIKEGDDVKVCPACNIPHHAECWAENKGCTTFGCSVKESGEQRLPVGVCRNCGAYLFDGQLFCPKCGTPVKTSSGQVCVKCGAEILEDQNFCRKCGHPIRAAAATVRKNVKMKNQRFSENKKKSFRKAVAVIISVVVFIVAFLIVFNAVIMPAIKYNNAWCLLYTETVSAGSSHTVGVKSDGTVVATGKNNYGRCDVDDWTDIVAVSAGASHTVGLKSDGTVIATGSDYNCRCDVDDWADIVAVSAGKDYTVGLRSDGTAVAVGNNYDGQCDVGAWKDIKLPDNKYFKLINI